MIRIFYILLLAVPLFGTTLDGLIKYTLKHSTAVKQSQMQIALAKIRKQESRVQQYGAFNFVGDYTHYNTARTLAPLTPTAIGSGAAVATTEDIFSTGITYSVPLFTGFAQTRQIEIENIASQMSTAKARLTQEQLVYNIRSLYLFVLAQKEILKAQGTYTVALQTLTKQIAYEVKVGKKARIDLLKARATMQGAHTHQTMLSSSIAMTKATLASLAGKSIGTLTPLRISVKKPRYNVASLYKKASGLAKIKIEELALERADKAIEKSRSSTLPQVNFSGYAGKNYGEDLATGQWKGETLWQVGVNVKWNLVDFGKSNLAEQKAKIAKMEAVFQKEQTLLDLRKLLTQGVEQIKQSYAQYLGSVAQLRLSKKSEKIEKVRYESGVATLNDLLLAKSQKHLAQAKRIESRYNYKKSQYYLDYLLEKGSK